jgi:hypothetical protein
MRWVKLYETECEITGYKRKPIAYKVHKEHIDFLLYPRIKQEKLRRTTYKMGVFNEKRCKKSGAKS